MTEEEIKRCTLHSIYVSEDGSSVQIDLTNPTGDHGLPCHELISLDINSAIEIISGIRLYFRKK